MWLIALICWIFMALLSSFRIGKSIESGNDEAFEGNLNALLASLLVCLYCVKEILNPNLS